jgi:hypothetical protein
LVMISAWLLVRHVPESRDQESSGPLDWRGAILVTAGLGGIACGLIEGPAAGWGSGTVLAGSDPRGLGIVDRGPSAGDGPGTRPRCNGGALD